MAPKSTQIAVDVTLDENHVPEKLNWHSSDNNEGGECQAALMSFWDAEQANSLKIDLWTKKMTVDDMNIFFHQNLLAMADTFNRATGNQELSFHMKEFARYFGEETGIIKKEE
jgi:gliding motility-associated protein GldC